MMTMVLIAILVLAILNFIIVQCTVAEASQNVRQLLSQNKYSDVRACNELTYPIWQMFPIICSVRNKKISLTSEIASGNFGAVYAIQEFIVGNTSQEEIKMCVKR